MLKSPSYCERSGRNHLRLEKFRPASAGTPRRSRPDKSAEGRIRKRSAALESLSWLSPGKTHQLSPWHRSQRSCTEHARRCRSPSRLPLPESSPIAHTSCTRPKVRSRKRANPCLAADEAFRALTTDPFCADARAQPCRRLHAAALPPLQLPRNAHATLQSCSIGTYARATLNLRERLNQADRTTNGHEYTRIPRGRHNAQIRGFLGSARAIPGSVIRAIRGFCTKRKCREDFHLPALTCCSYMNRLTLKP